MRELRWNCLTQGCFRGLCPRLGEFDECFPGRIGMSDVDGVVEVGGRLLFLEWKSPGGALTTGQRILFERLTSISTDPCRVVVIVAFGDPATMEVEHVQVVQGGRAGEVEASSLADLRRRMTAWSDRAIEARTRPSRRPA